MPPRHSDYTALLYFFVFLFSLAPPKVQLLGPNWTMREGDRLNLTCIIKAGLPKPQVSWYKNNLLLVDEESTNLILEELTDKDEGQYKCEARNPAGVADAMINVTVDSKSSGEVLAFVLPWSIFVPLNFVKSPFCSDSLWRLFFT